MCVYVCDVGSLVNYLEYTPTRIYEILFYFEFTSFFGSPLILSYILYIYFFYIHGRRCCLLLMHSHRFNFFVVLGGRRTSSLFLFSLHDTIMNGFANLRLVLHSPLSRKKVPSILFLFPINKLNI